MYKFGSSPPRSLETFGVTGLLGETCKVYYDALFTTKSLGRVSDLLSVRLREVGLDELKFRTLLLFGFFEAYRARGPAEGGADPLTIECGLDEEKIAIGISFAMDPEAFQNVIRAEGLLERVQGSKPNGDFEGLLIGIHSHSDQLVIRSDARSMRVEVVSLLAIPGKMTATEKQAPVLVVLDQVASPESAPAASEYTQLADLPYPELLKEEESQGKKTEFSTGQMLSKRVTLKEQAKPDQEKSFEQEKQDDKLVRISGSSEKIEDKVFRVKGESKAPEEEKSSAPAEQGGEDGKGIKGLIKNVWPFGQKKAQSEESEDSGENQESPPEAEASEKREKAEKPESVEKPEKPAKPQEIVLDLRSPKPDRKETVIDNSLVEPETAPNADADMKSLAQALNAEFTISGFAKTVERLQSRNRDFAKDQPDSPMRSILEGLLEELLADKLRMSEVSRKLLTTVRQKEVEGKSREHLFAEEIRRKDELIHQRGTALTLAKEQLAQATVMLEKAKASAQAKTVASSSGDDAAYKQKYTMSQKLLVLAREDNSRLNAKLEDTKAQLATLQLSQKNADMSVQTENSSLKLKVERLGRQLAQMKQLNDQMAKRMQQNTQKMAERSETTAASKGTAEETKRRLESAMRMIATQQKEIEDLKAKANAKPKASGDPSKAA